MANHCDINTNHCDISNHKGERGDIKGFQRKGKKQTTSKQKM